MGWGDGYSVNILKASEFVPFKQMRCLVYELYLNTPGCFFVLIFLPVFSTKRRRGKAQKPSPTLRRHELPSVRPEAPSGLRDRAGGGSALQPRAGSSLRGSGPEACRPGPLPAPVLRRCGGTPTAGPWAAGGGRGTGGWEWGGLLS